MGRDIANLLIVEEAYLEALESIRTTYGFVEATEIFVELKLLNDTCSEAKPGRTTLLTLRGGSVSFGWTYLRGRQSE